MFKVTSAKDQNRSERVESDEHKRLQLDHINLVHPGTKTFYNTVKNYYSMKNLKKSVEKIVDNCITCQAQKSQRNYYAPFKGSLTSQMPFQDISTDIYGPIPGSEIALRGGEEFSYILTIIDRCTRWAIVKPMKEVTSKEVIRILQDYWIKPYGIPRTLLSDQGRQYTSKEFNNELQEWKIYHLMSTSYNPRGNSISERINQVIARAFRCQRNIPIKQVCK